MSSPGAGSKSQGQHHKPAPEPVIFGAQLLGAEPSACLYVGDSPFDMQAGRDAGCKTVAVTWGMFSRDTLAAEHPDFMVDTFEELIDLAAR